MKIRKLSPTGDFAFGNSQNNFISNSPETVAQLVLTTLRLIQGEWYLDVTAGTPYFQGIIGKHSQDLADATLVAVISNVQGVVNIVNYQSTLDPETRQYSSVKGTINTVYGQTALNIQNIQNNTTGGT